jgi:murein DD-endopeptidase MepM/ murein hydrolase activator NlpD
VGVALLGGVLTMVLVGWAATSAAAEPGVQLVEPEGAQPVEPDPNDPLRGEGPAEDPPDDDIVVPPPSGGYGGQGRFEPRGVLWSSVAAAERKREAAWDAEIRRIEQVRNNRLALKRLDQQRARLDLASTATTEELLQATERYARRAVTGFRLFVADDDLSTNRFGVLAADPVGQTDDVMRRDRLIASALEVDEADTARLDALRAGLGREQRSVLTRRQLAVDQLAQADEAAREAQRAARQAEVEYSAFRAGSEVYIDNVVFPIGGTYEPFIDSFGFPRMTGTPDEHWHEGIDLFAPRGTPLVAAERGVIARMGTGRLGGLKLWLIGESGSEWYYAHLDAFAPELTDGVVVDAGDLVGYVGNTGNAVGTPPHLHLQLHPNGGRPVNPYPLLKVVSDAEAERRAVGDPSVAWVHEPREP